MIRINIYIYIYYIDTPLLECLVFWMLWTKTSEQTLVERGSDHRPSRWARCLPKAFTTPTPHAGEPELADKADWQRHLWSIKISSCTSICIFLLYALMHIKPADATLPTQQNSTHVHSHTYADREILGQQPTQLYEEFPRIHRVGH